MGKDPLARLKVFRALSLFIAVLLLGCSPPLKTPIPSTSDGHYLHEGFRIRYQDLGSGRPLVFLHGFGASLDTWRFVVNDLKGEHRLILLDLKGHGLSDRPRDENYSIQDHARVVLGLLRHLGIADSVLVGHSFGAAVALAAALEAKKNSGGVTGLVLIGASVNPDHLPFFLRLLRFPLIGWLSVRLTTASFRTRLMLRRAYYDDQKVTDSLVELYARYQLIPGTEYGFLKTAEQLVPENLFQLQQQFSKLDLPILHIWGEQDKVIPRAGGESVCQMLSPCKFVTIPETGHIPHEEKPEEVIPLIRTFVRSLS